MSPSRGYSLWILLSMIVLCSAQVIIQPPENVTEFLNQDAVFTCETDGGNAGWFFNGTVLGDLSFDIRQDLQHTHSVTTSGIINNLTIPARDVYNDTTVQCVIFSLGPLVRSDAAMLYIQGPLSAVGDLIASYSRSSVTVNWTAPFSLDVTGVDHDIWYSVIIYNVTDENNSTVINCTDCINITDTYYIFTLSPCAKYNVTVLTLNGVGQGELSHSITINIGGIKLGNMSITDLQNGPSVLRNVTFSVDSDMIENVTLNDGKGETYFAVDIVGYNVTFELPGDEVYYATFDVDFDCGRKINILQRHFTTYDIQSPKADGNGNSIHVNGTFINNSTAIGFFLAIEYNSTTKISFVALKRNPSDLFVSENVQLPPSYYTVYAHDLEEDGLPNINPANLDFNNITVTESGSPGDTMTPSTSISQSGSNVTVRCTDEQESGSCLLVYRAYRNSTLSFSDGPFPIELFLNVSVAVNYTFALFRNLSEDGEDGINQIFPFEIMMILIEPSGSQTVMPTSSPSPTGVPVEPTGIVVGVVIGLVFGLVVVILVIVAVWIRKRKKTMPCSKHVPEDEVNYSSGSFDSQPNLLRLSTDSQRSTAPLIAEDGGRKEKEEEKEESKYATVVTKPSGLKPPLPLDTDVKYGQIDLRATQKLARSPYAEMGPRPSNAPKTMPHIPDTLVPYVEVQLQAPVPVIDPPTVETVMSKLYDKSDQWKEIAEMMEFDEDLIDEIDTNNDADVTCLQVCVEMWVSKFNPSWDHVYLILSQLRERAGERALQEVMETYNSENVLVVPETSQTNSSNGAVVTGVDETMFHNDNNNNNNNDDSNRGEKIFPRNEEQQSVDSAVTIQNHTTLQGDDPSLFTCKVEDEITVTGYEATLTEMVSPVVFPLCSGDDGSMTKYQLSDDACYVGVNLTTCQPAKQDSMIESISVSGGDSANDYDLVSLCVGKKETVNNTNITEMKSFRNTEGVQVVPQRYSDYGGFVGAENEEGLKQREVTICNDCVDEELPGCSYFKTKTSSQTEPSFFTREGATVMVTGVMRKSIPTHEEQHHNQSLALETSDLMTTPTTTPVAKKLSPSSSSKSFLPRCTLPPSPPKRVSRDLPHVNPWTSSYYYLPLPTESRDSTEKPSSPVKTEQWQDPPATANFHQKIVKWMSCGIKRGSMEMRLCSEGPLT